ncbi:hypothetical protein MAXJ12_32774 [Mesorhizobium alhagi CCNWXJ12-2]|uniref:Uncharacterized protein n=1 Tax=Mesorhizobium alhagi CCNWXJ12-2 TaxID=1107882 RepID=H0I257_9HYPH|nr:hypothetical protein MAXJ12_32774 [Mesorhizobium alhagi CCNWXJ12-2]
MGVALLVALLAYALWRPSIPAWLFAAFCDLRSDQVPQCDHSRALVETENSAILTASEAVTGDKASWMQTPRFDQRRVYKRDPDRILLD